jgi:hypothetical protein
VPGGNTVIGRTGAFDNAVPLTIAANVRRDRANAVQVSGAV